VLRGAGDPFRESYKKHVEFILKLYLILEDKMLEVIISSN
jgi:hypothetical protein